MKKKTRKPGKVSGEKSDFFLLKGTIQFRGMEYQASNFSNFIFHFSQSGIFMVCKSMNFWVWS